MLHHVDLPSDPALPQLLAALRAVQVITYVLLSGALPFFHHVLHKLCAIQPPAAASSRAILGPIRCFLTSCSCFVAFFLQVSSNRGEGSEFSRSGWTVSQSEDHMEPAHIFVTQAWKNVSKGALDFILRLLQAQLASLLDTSKQTCLSLIRGLLTNFHQQPCKDFAIIGVHSASELWQTQLWTSLDIFGQLRLT